MCYVIITSASLVWFLCSLVADMLFAVALVTPKWLVGPAQATNSSLNPHRQSSVGIYTRCKVLQEGGKFHCGRFDLDGLATDGSVYPGEWKAAMIFASLGFTLLSVTVLLTLLTCCRQSAFGKSIHNMTACAQVVAGKSQKESVPESAGVIIVFSRNKRNAGPLSASDRLASGQGSTFVRFRCRAILSRRLQYRNIFLLRSHRRTPHFRRRRHQSQGGVFQHAHPRLQTRRGGQQTGLHSVAASRCNKHNL
ncbi:LHFPL tetraspan subfamily member 2a protein isoform X1 [Drosophila rhopaloa]|uniref:Lipoma HMGIC fusion partner-like 2 protein isoform X1 n=1 Tax=Drosophila rhopaloa TaxID=1041015 RepID=A0A6P4ET78_DRORH|nr:LHFPL tetraspan subfamily member 2a protein isoform X1 [Drosophila rhopaloa]